MAWGQRTCSVNCGLPSSKVTKVISYGDISGPGVVAGFVITAGIIVLSVAATYLLGSDSQDEFPHADENVVDEIVLGSTRKMGTYAKRLIPSRISSWLAQLRGQHRVRQVLSTSLLAMSDIQIFTGLAILIRGSAALCPSPTLPNGLPAYHWQMLVHLAWFSVITHQGNLFVMRKYFREHDWQRNVRLSLMCAQLALLMIALLPTASFNWYSKRRLVLPSGPSDPQGFVPDNWMVSYSMLSKSAAQPISPASCYFDISRANDLYRSADPCRWTDITPIRPPQLTFAASWIIREVISTEMAGLSTTIRDQAGLDNSSSSSLDLDSRREQYCDPHTSLSGTDAFQTTVLGMTVLAVLLMYNAARLFGFPLGVLEKRIRSSTSRYSRRAIENMSRLAMHKFPTTGHRPDLTEGLVTTPLLALHLTGRLMLDMFTSQLAKVLLLMFVFVQGCITLYPAHDPYFQRVESEGWTLGQILAALFPLSPLALVVLEILVLAWRASRNQSANLNIVTAFTETEGFSHDRDTKLRGTKDGHLEAFVTELDAKQTRHANEQGHYSASSDSVTSVLDSSEYRSSKWMSIAVWLLVVTVTLLGCAQLIYAYVGYSGPVRLSTLLRVSLVTLPASCYVWALMGLHIRSERAHYASGYRHGSRFIKWTTTPSVAQFMKLTAVFGPLGIFMLTLVDVLASQDLLSQGTQGREWVVYLFCGSYSAIVSYFLESIHVNFVMWFFNRATPRGNSPGPCVAQ